MKKISEEQQEDLLSLLEKRFHRHSARHPQVKWENVYERLKNNLPKLSSLYEMEETGGEPDVIGLDEKSGVMLFADCAAETPKGRRSICYDHEALESRKQHKPEDSAVNMAEEMGIEMLDEEQYFKLQELGEFDLKTSTWLKTPVEVRKLGGALFGDKRFGRVFIYHNGAESYYAARGFRGILKV